MGHFPLADVSPTVALVVAGLAVVGSIAAALVAVLGAQRARETEFQARRRDAYVRMMTALRTGALVQTEGPYDYTALLEEVRQLSPDIRQYINAHVPDPVQALNTPALTELQDAIDFQQKPWIFRPWGLNRPDWLDVG